MLSKKNLLVAVLVPVTEAYSGVLQTGPKCLIPVLCATFGFAINPMQWRVPFILQHNVNVIKPLTNTVPNLNSDFIPLEILPDNR